MRPYDIRIGTMVRVHARTAASLEQILSFGFESIQLYWHDHLRGVSLQDLAEPVMRLCREYGTVISGFGIYGNPLDSGERGELCRRSWYKAVEAAAEYECDLLCGFTGRVPGTPIPDSLEAFSRFFTPLAQVCVEKGLRIAFENSPMGGDWHTGDHNMAINPDAWELIFEQLPYDHVGLEWEPAHQIAQLIEPLDQIKQWAERIFHVHGSDARVLSQNLSQYGLYAPLPWYEERLPSLGQTDWRQLIAELRRVQYTGTIDIEGYHDPAYRKELELTGQVMALQYLKECRGSVQPRPLL
jgi:sugar phosphate isomerase/epimerase